MTTVLQIDPVVNPSCETAYLRAVVYVLEANALTADALALLLQAAARGDRAAERRLLRLEGGRALYPRYLRVFGMDWDEEFDTLTPPALPARIPACRDPHGRAA